MDKRELEKLLEDIASSAKQATLRDFESPKAARKDAQNLKTQKWKHRDRLLKLVGGLSIASFALLAITVLMQMIIRIFQPKYPGISDIALNILAVSVFGEVIAVVGTIVSHVWRDPK